MQTEEIISTLLAAAAFLKKPFQEVATQTVKDLYSTITYYMRKKFGRDSDGAKVLELALEKPESGLRKAVLAEEAMDAGLASDPDLVRLMEQLSALLPKATDSGRAQVRVTGDRNTVVVAGRDVVHTERLIRRAAITPDERHVTPEQRDQLRQVIGELAARLADEEGKPNFAAGHRMIQRRFGIASYLVLPREKFPEALAFLKQQRAARRSHLRSRNPAAYKADLCRAIFSRAGELGWDRPRVYAYAAEKLGLKRPVGSLHELGSRQLPALLAHLRRAA